MNELLCRSRRIAKQRSYQSADEGFKRWIQPWVAYMLLLMMLVCINMALMLLQTRTSPSSDDESTDSTSNHQLLSSTGAGVVNGMVIAICSRVMSNLVVRLTNYEVPAWCFACAQT